MHGNNPTRDSIERALDFAVSEGLIRSWKQVPFAGGARHAKWEVEVNASVHSADGLGTYTIRTYQEGKLFCAALASARAGLQPQIDAWAEKVDKYRQVLDLEPGADDTEVIGEPAWEPPGYQPAQLAQIFADVGLVDVKVGRYGSFPVVITGVFPRGAEAGLRVFRVAESLDRAPGTTDRMSEPLWAAIFEPAALDWVTSPIESWEGLTAPQICDKITGWL